MSISKFPEKAQEGKTEEVPEHLKDLPPEVLKQLSLTYKKGNDLQTEKETLEEVKTLIKEAGKPLTVDDLIVGYYRKWEKLIKRNNLSAQLSRMKQKGLLLCPNGRKYDIPEESR